MSDAPDLLADAEPGTGGPTAPARGRLLLAAGLVVIAFNLRPVFSSLSPVLPELMRDLDISPALAGLVTTLPVFCLGLFAPVAPEIARHLGAERLILCLLVVLAAGTALRGVVAYPSVLFGSLLAGAAIAMANVLLPGLVKRDFAERQALMTGLYSMALCAGAALAAGATVPLQRALGGSWAHALAFWSLPVLAAILLWLPQARHGSGERRHGASSLLWLWRDPLAWQVTMFMGMQSALAYSVFGWLAPILRERGLDAATAGYVVSVSVLMQVVTSLVSPWAATRGRDQRLVAILLISFALAGLLGALFAPLASIWVWAVIQGVGQGGLFSVAMTIIILRSPDARVAAALSGMAQGVGYVLAGFAPLLVGLIRTWTGGFSWTAPLFVFCWAGSVAAALGAGRTVLVGGTRPLGRRSARQAAARTPSDRRAATPRG